MLLWLVVAEGAHRRATSRPTTTSLLLPRLVLVEGAHRRATSATDQQLLVCCCRGYSVVEGACSSQGYFGDPTAPGNATGGAACRLCPPGAWCCSCPALELDPGAGPMWDAAKVGGLVEAWWWPVPRRLPFGHEAMHRASG